MQHQMKTVSLPLIIVLLLSITGLTVKAQNKSWVRINLLRL